MFTADQIVAHLVGDYLLQSHAMATRKTSDSSYCALHVVCYCVAFVPLVPSGWMAVLALLMIGLPHYLIDRYRLARYVVWAKNGFHGPVTATGYPEETPPFLAVWLLIIADNTLHILTNGIALRIAS